jgi:hypothetical protein
LCQREHEGLHRGPDCPRCCGNTNQEIQVDDNQYSESNAAFQVDGYYIRSTNTTVRGAFDFAKRQAILELQKRIESIERLDFAKWTSITEVPEAQKVVD